MLDRGASGWLKGVGFVAVAAVSIALVVVRAERDAGDPARCGGLRAMGNRCCAPGQTGFEGHCSGRPAQCPPGLDVTADGCVAAARRVLIQGGMLHAGAGDWESAGRVISRDVQVSMFELDVFEATEQAYSACMAAQQCPRVALSGEPGRAVGGVTRTEAEAYCAFQGGRLPSDDEWTFAAGGSKARRYPWGDTGAVCRRGAWGLANGPCGFGFVGPELAGAHPDGASFDGVRDLAGNVAEWVTGPPGEEEGVVRGGSFVSALATDLRAWHATKAATGARSSDVGVRCAYDHPLEAARPAFAR